MFGRYDMSCESAVYGDNNILDCLLSFLPQAEMSVYPAPQTLLMKQSIIFILMEKIGPRLSPIL